MTVVASARSRTAFIDIFRWDPSADRVTKNVVEQLASIVRVRPDAKFEEGAAVFIQRIVRGRLARNRLGSLEEVRAARWPHVRTYGAQIQRW